MSRRGIERLSDFEPPKRQNARRGKTEILGFAQGGLHGVENARCGELGSRRAARHLGRASPRRGKPNPSPSSGVLAFWRLVPESFRGAPARPRDATYLAAAKQPSSQGRAPSGRLRGAWSDRSRPNKRLLRLRNICEPSNGSQIFYRRAAEITEREQSFLGFARCDRSRRR